jgi:hypothetical protein
MFRAAENIEPKNEIPRKALFSHSKKIKEEDDILRKINEGKITGDRNTLELKDRKNELNEDLVSFIDFLEKNKQEIEERVVMGEKLEDIIYDDFYSRNIKNLLVDGEPETERLQSIYQESIGKIESEIESRIESDWEKMDGSPLFIKTDKNSYWLQVKVHDGLNVREDTIGRMYFNLSAEHTADFFKKVIDACAEAGVRMEIKMSRRGDTYTLNRFDKVILYFNADEESEIIKIVERLHSENIDYFNEENTPRFTGKIRDSKGEVMKGVGFGEEPTARGESFGSIRSKILAELVSEAQKQGYSIFNPRFNIKKSFKELCDKYGVDYRNPAFNNQRKNGKDFNEIRERCGNLII